MSSASETEHRLLSADERLIEDQQVRTVHQRGRELNTLLVALRKLIDPRARAVA